MISEKHLNGINGNEVWLYKIVNGEHDWPGAWGNMDISASVEAWLFFERFLSFSTATNDIFSEKETLVISPNPVSDLAYLQVSENRVGEKYVVFDIEGKKIKTGIISSTKTKISFDMLAKGLYFINVGNENALSVKFLKK